MVLSSMLDGHEPLCGLGSPEGGRQRGRDGEGAVLGHRARHALGVDAARQREALRDVPKDGIFNRFEDKLDFSQF